MQRERGELVPIGGFVSGLDDELVPTIRARSPQARHHFTVADQVDQLVSALLHKSLRHVRLSPMGQGASMRNDAESIHVPVPSTQLVRLQSGADRQGASDLLVR